VFNTVPHILTLDRWCEEKLQSHLPRLWRKGVTLFKRSRGSRYDTIKSTVNTSNPKL